MIKFSEDLLPFEFNGLAKFEALNLRRGSKFIASGKFSDDKFGDGGKFAASGKFNDSSKFDTSGKFKSTKFTSKDFI
ncbi:MAG: hypothetical protein LUC34_03585 [Campylobacter sp.]|nr:hypothetical protein [Campylobacter sp.]